MFQRWWQGFVETVVAPKANDEAIQAELAKAKATIPAPVLWLLGKAQSGKSSIVQGITGSSEIEIGEGWRACTRTSRVHDFPDAQESLIRFLDTRGIGEPGYVPDDDVTMAMREAHGVLVVMRACDPAQAAVKNILTAVRKQRRSWPVILVQTTLHEGYPSGIGHPDGYAFGPDGSPLPDALPSDLARALAWQHDDFKGLFDRHVAIDFTHPIDGYEPRLYGAEALWDALQAVLPAGYREVLARRPDATAGIGDVLFQTAFPHIVASSLIAGAAVTVPVPVANLSGVLLAQTKMLHAIASIYHQSLTKGLVALGPAIGTGFLTRSAARSIVGIAPFVGSATAALLTASSTYALGHVLCWYFAQVRRGVVPGDADIRRAYAEALTSGRERFNDYFRRQSRPARGPTHDHPSEP